MTERYDALIIGAGLGGLTAAVRLLEEGLRVLVVEAGPHPGGTAYSYERKGFSFPMGPLGFSSPDLVRDTLIKAGIDEPLDLRRVHYELRAFGLRAPLSLPCGEMITRLAALFPEEEAGISRFFGHMKEISSIRDRLAREGRARSRQAEDVSAASYISGLVVDWRLRRILGSMGSREPYSGITLLAAMWSLLCDKGIHYPAGGMRRLSDALAVKLGWEPADVYRQSGCGSKEEPRYDNGSPVVPGKSGSLPAAGGSLRLSTEVVEIMVEAGRVGGVVLSDGSRLNADAVISNADFKATFLRLIPRDSVPGDLYRSVSTAGQTPSNLQVCLGLDASRVDFSAFNGASRIIYRRNGNGVPPHGSGPDWDAEEIDPEILATEELEATLLSDDDPLLAPGGGAVLVIRVAFPFRHFARFRPRRKRRVPGYFAYKTSLAKALIREVSGFVPGLGEAIVYMDVATPLTFEERGGRSEGAVAGWSWEHSEGSAGEVLELIRTPIAGLYMAGYQAYSMLALGGVPSAMFSGLKAAEYLLADAFY